MNTLFVIGAVVQAYLRFMLKALKLFLAVSGCRQQAQKDA